MSSAAPLTRVLTRWMTRAAPRRRQDWAQAMAREIAEIGDERTALRWAIGCVFACLMERITSMRILMIVVRVGLAGACGLFALGAALPVAMIIAYRKNWTWWLSALEGSTAGDDIDRFAILLRDTPKWLVGGGFVTITLCVAAAVLVLLRRTSAAWVFALAAMLSGATIVATHNMTLFQDVFSPEELRSDYVGLALKIAVAAAMFWAVRRPAGAPVA